MNTTIRALVKSPAVTVGVDDTLGLALQVMTWGDVRHLPVLSGGRLVGVLSERDILRRLVEKGRRAGARETVGQAMSSPPVTIAPGETVEVAGRMVAERGLGCLPVVERFELIGIVTRRDLLNAAVGTERDDLESAESGEAGSEERPRWDRLCVDDVMSRPALTAAADDSLVVIAERMDRHGVRHIPVVDGDQHVVGMLSDRDIRTAIGDLSRVSGRRDLDVQLQATRVADAMTRDAITVAAGTRLSRAMSLFADLKTGALPVIDNKEVLLGIVSYTDVLRAVLGRKSNLS